MKKLLAASLLVVGLATPALSSDLAPLGRFPGLKVAEMSKEQLDSIKQLDGPAGVPSPFRFLATSPYVTKDLGQLWLDIRAGKKLSERELEIVTLVVATEMKSEWVLVGHRKTGVSVGLSDAVLDAILGARVPPLTNEHERAVYELTVSLLHENPVPAAKAAAFQKTLGNEAVADVIGYLAVYSATAQVMRFVDARP